MSESEIKKAIREAIQSGNWMLRADNDGVSYGGFKWRPIGEWTTAPDWSQSQECGRGLHGVNHVASGFALRGDLVFCETRGPQIDLQDKVKVQSARRLFSGIPSGLSFGSWLDLRGTAITSLPEGLKVGGGLDLRGTAITSLPEGLQVGGGLYLSRTAIKGKYRVVNGLVRRAEG